MHECDGNYILGVRFRGGMRAELRLIVMGRTGLLMVSLSG